MAAILLSCGALAATPGTLDAQSLTGSQASLDRQNAQAASHDYTFLRTHTQVRTFVDQGYIVQVVPNADFELVQVSYPYARSEVKLFVERLASQYRAACGEKLVVTSLTRPLSAQPANASDRSVHPTGMAVDLRRSNNSRCRTWLEQVLLQLEGDGVVEATRENNPPHYHIAVYPQPYARYVQARAGASEILAATAPAPTPSGGSSALVTYTVARGETLSDIALRHGTSVTRIRAENGLSSDRILVGQRLRVPSVTPAAPASPVLASVEPPPVTFVAAVPDGSEGSRPAESVSDQPVRHRVGSGESLWTIARLYGVTEDLLRAANGIRGSTILAGQVLSVPTPAVGTGVLRYTVRNGDSLWVIANRLGTTVDEIRERNGMGTTRIYAGQILDVPYSR